MKKYRYKQVTGCTKCNKKTNTGAGECCPFCGGTFLHGDIIHDFVIKEIWVETPVKWWNPFSWQGGYWMEIPV